MPALWAIRCRMGPTTTSVSTFSMTMCLPHWIEWRAIRAPSSGLPVASTTTSTGSRGRELCILGSHGPAAADRVGGRADVVGHQHLPRVVAAEPKRPFGPVHRQVGDDRIADAPHQSDLRKGTRAHPARADEADLDRPVVGLPPIERLPDHVPSPSREVSEFPSQVAHAGDDPGDGPPVAPAQFQPRDLRAALCQSDAGARAGTRPAHRGQVGWRGPGSDRSC